MAPFRGVRCPAPKPIVQQPHVYLGNSGLLQVATGGGVILPYHQQQKRCPRMNSNLDFLSIIWGYLPNHCVYDLCLSRSFLLFFVGLPKFYGTFHTSKVGTQKHLQITAENRINQTPSEHRQKAFGKKSRGVETLHQNTKVEGSLF